MSDVYFGNTLNAYIWFFGWIIGAFLLRKFTPKILIKTLYKVFKKQVYEIPVERVHENLGKPIGDLIFVIFVYVAVQYIDFPPSWNLVETDQFGLKKVLLILYQILFGIVLIRVFLGVADIISLVMLKKYEEDEERTSMVNIIPFATDFMKLMIGLIGALIILSTVFSINVGAIVAGLGIGGIAIAMAAKETLENLLGSFIIYMDKPFEIGDFIKVKDTYCTVEKVGFRSSRLRTLQQSRITMPNKMLVESSIDNYTLRTSRRTDRVIQLSRQTSYSQITQIIAEVKEYIINHELTINDTYVNFHEIGNSSLDIRIQYYVNADWEGYLGVVGNINLEILKIIEQNGTQLAYPTRTLNFPALD